MPPSVLCRDWQPATPDRMPVLGVPEGAYLEQASPEGLAAFERQVATLEQAGYTVRRVPALDDIAAITERHTWMTTAEMAAIHADWFPAHEAKYRPVTAETYPARGAGDAGATGGGAGEPDDGARGDAVTDGRARHRPLGLPARARPRAGGHRSQPATRR